MSRMITQVPVTHLITTVNMETLPTPTPEESNALYAASLFWEADRAQRRAEKFNDRLNDFMRSHVVDIRRYMELTKLKDEHETIQN